MKRISIFFLSVLTTSLVAFTFSPAYAGGMDAGGGYGYLCFEKQQRAKSIVDRDYQLTEEDLAKILKIIPIDLLIAQSRTRSRHNRGGLFSPESSDTHESFNRKLFAYIEELSPELAEKIQNSEEVLGGENIREGGALPRPEDLGQFFGMQEGVVRIGRQYCVAIPIAIQYQEDGVDILKFDMRIFNHEKMSIMAKTVLWLHEMIYFHVRKTRNHKTSGPTTIAVSYLMQGKGSLRPENTEKILKSLDILE